MENLVRNSKLKIEKEIKRIEQQTIALLDRIKQIIDVIQTSLTLLKSAVAEYQFQNPEEEIQFFKVWKPQISGLLMFYIRLYQIEKNCRQIPVGSMQIFKDGTGEYTEVIFE